MTARVIPAGLEPYVHAALTTLMHFIWETVRLPLVAVLTLLESLVRGVFGLAMVLGIIVAILFEISAVGSRFPFLEMLELSLGFGAALLGYYGLLFLVSR
ncbi:MAG: hypothetical protein WD793_12695 [Steroidobacteraceae bacterium]